MAMPEDNLPPIGDESWQSTGHQTAVSKYVYFSKPSALSKWIIGCMRLDTERWARDFGCHTLCASNQLTGL